MIPELTEEPDPVADILTEAFTGDPFMSWVFNNPETHVEALATWWAFLTANRPEGAELWLADDGSSAALWYPPREPKPRVDRPGGAELDGRAGGAELEGEAGSAEPHDNEDDEVDAFVEMMTGLVGVRLSQVLAMFGQVVEAHLEEPHWYLAAVGTRTSAQGKGSGRRLLEPVLERCDEQGLVAYLESSNPRNVPFYHRQGFEVIGELVTPDEVALVTLMSRRPR